jgi:hypothetical protein
MRLNKAKLGIEAGEEVFETTTENIEIIDETKHLTTKSQNYISKIEITKPNDRHFFKKIIQGKYEPHSNLNTVAEPHVDMIQDILDINQGKSIKLPNNQVQINGRIYGIHTESGRAYPIKGDGLVQLTRGGYNAVGVLNKFGGPTEKALSILAKMYNVTEEDIKIASKLWRLYNP